MSGPQTTVAFTTQCGIPVRVDTTGAVFIHGQETPATSQDIWRALTESIPVQADRPQRGKRRRCPVPEDCHALIYWKAEAADNPQT